MRLLTLLGINLSTEVAEEKKLSELSKNDLTIERVAAAWADPREFCTENETCQDWTQRLQLILETEGGRNLVATIRYEEINYIFEREMAIFSWDYWHEQGIRVSKKEQRAWMERFTVEVFPFEYAMDLGFGYVPVEYWKNIEKNYPDLGLEEECKGRACLNKWYADIFKKYRKAEGGFFPIPKLRASRTMGNPEEICKSLYEIDEPPYLKWSRREYLGYDGSIAQRVKVGAGVPVEKFAIVGIPTRNGKGRLAMQQDACLSSEVPWEEIKGYLKSLGGDQVVVAFPPGI